MTLPINHNNNDDNKISNNTSNDISHSKIIYSSYFQLISCFYTNDSKMNEMIEYTQSLYSDVKRFTNALTNMGKLTHMYNKEGRNVLHGHLLFLISGCLTFIFRTGLNQNLNLQHGFVYYQANRIIYMSTSSAGLPPDIRVFVFPLEITHTIHALQSDLLSMMTNDLENIYPKDVWRQHVLTTYFSLQKDTNDILIFREANLMANSMVTGHDYTNARVLGRKTLHNMEKIGKGF